MCYSLIFSDSRVLNQVESVLIRSVYGKVVGPVGTFHQFTVELEVVKRRLLAASLLREEDSGNESHRNNGYIKPGRPSGHLHHH